MTTNINASDRVCIVHKPGDSVSFQSGDTKILTVTTWHVAKMGISMIIAIALAQQR